MPTEEWFKENPKISAYISPELSRRLEEWMKEQGIRKTSQALVRILGEHLGVVQFEPKQSTPIGREIAILEEKMNLLSRELKDLKEAVSSIQNESKPKVVQTELLFAKEPTNKSSLLVEESSLILETQSTEGLKPEMNNKELEIFLGWTPDTLRGRRERKRPIEGKGISFIWEKRGQKIVWKPQTVDLPESTEITSS